MPTYAFEYTVGGEEHLIEVDAESPREAADHIASIGQARMAGEVTGRHVSQDSEDVVLEVRAVANARDGARGWLGRLVRAVQEWAG